MPCDSPSTCDCVCTQVTVDPAGVADVIQCDVFPDHFTDCKCSLAGTGTTYAVAMWVSDAGILFVSLDDSFETFTGYCEGAVCDGSNRFTCGGNVTCWNALRTASVDVEINGDACVTSSCPQSPACVDKGVQTTCPEMIISVSGMVNKTVNWCGKTWVLNSVDGGESGKTEIVCPTNYIINRDPADSPPPGVNSEWLFSQQWRYYGHLSLFRGMDSHELRFVQAGNAVEIALGNRTQHAERIQMTPRVTGATTWAYWGLDDHRWSGRGVGTVDNYNVTQYNYMQCVTWLSPPTLIGAVCPVGVRPTLNAYRIRGVAANASYTKGNITFSWSQGAGW